MGGHVTAPLRDCPAWPRLSRFAGAQFLELKVETMMHPTLSAASLIELHEAQQRGEEPARPIIVHDLAVVSEPERSMMFDPNRGIPTVVVRTVGNTPFFIERIELLQPDADERLGRYKPRRKEKA